jgi:hypothetical protein
VLSACGVSGGLHQKTSGGRCAPVVKWHRVGLRPASCRPTRAAVVAALRHVKNRILLRFGGRPARRLGGEGLFPPKPPFISSLFRGGVQPTNAKARRASCPPEMQVPSAHGPSRRSLAAAPRPPMPPPRWGSAGPPVPVAPLRRPPRWAVGILPAGPAAILAAAWSARRHRRTMPRSCGLSVSSSHMWFFGSAPTFFSGKTAVLPDFGVPSPAVLWYNNGYPGGLAARKK